MKAAFILLFAASVAGAQTPPLEVKGVPLGASMEELKAKLPAFDCAKTSCTLFMTLYVNKQCPTRMATAQSPQVWADCVSNVRDPLKFGPANVSYYEASFMDGALGRVFIRIGQIAADQVVIALTEKYGKPTSDSVTSIQNRAGATFDSRVVVWLREDGQIRVEQRYGNVDEGAVIISSKTYDAATSKATVDQAKASAKGL